ncbi:hypothetical protein JCM33774_87090 [Actinophytocola sp. KF-1]
MQTPETPAPTQAAPQTHPEPRQRTQAAQTPAPVKASEINRGLRPPETQRTEHHRQRGPTRPELSTGHGLRPPNSSLVAATDKTGPQQPNHPPAQAAVTNGQPGQVRAERHYYIL